MDDEFSSAVRYDGLYGAVFEVDEATAYLYLLDMIAAEGGQIIHAYRVPQKLEGDPNGEVRWSSDGDLAAVFRGERIAVLDLEIARQDTKQAGREPSINDSARFDIVH
jgi:hypothetical protein